VKACWRQMEESELRVTSILGKIPSAYFPNLQSS
jgi:hypothetical protein